jgi:hypothetical protein
MKMRTISLAIVFAILAWTIGLNAVRADCQMPNNPDSYSTAWYYNCTRDEAAQQQYQAQQQEDRIQALEAQRRGPIMPQ